MLAKLEGSRTYIVAFLVATLGLAEALGWTPPGWLTTVLAAAGITTVRMAIANTK